MARPSIATFDFLDPILRERLSDPEVAAAWGDAQRRPRTDIPLDKSFERLKLAGRLEGLAGGRQRPLRDK
jgi:hypothetical protein